MNNGELPVGWSAQTLGDLFDFKGGGTPDKKNPEYWGGEIPWASVKDIKFQYLTNTIDRITEKGLKESAANLATPGDLVLLTRIEPGKVTIVKTPVAVNQDCKIAKPLDCVDVDWAYYLFLAIEREFIKRSSGTTVLGIRLNDVNEIPVSLPPLNEQHRIVVKIEELFSELDKGIEALKTAREQLKVYRQAVLKHAFEGKLTAQWREQNKDKLEYPEQLLARIQQERQTRYQQQLQDWQAAVKAWEKNGKEGKKPGKPRSPKLQTSPSTEKLLPNYWAHVKLESVSHEVTDGDHQAPPKVKEGIPFITISNIKKDLFSIDFSSTFYVPESYYDAIGGNRKAKQGDLLYTVTGSYGIPVLIDFDSKFCFQRHIGLISPVSIINPKWLFYLLQSSVVKEQADRTATGTAQKTVALSSLRDFSIPLCPKVEQNYIANLLDTAMSEIDNAARSIADEIARSETLRQSILKKAFSGQLVPQDPNDEPASALLERIRAEKAVQTKPGTGSKRKKKA